MLQDASFNMIRGRRYALIGRNGKGKSTMLKALAARRVGDIPSNVSMHYVSQEVKLTEETMNMTPLQAVIAADIERKLLMEEMEHLESLDELSNEQSERQNDVIGQLEIIEADSAERRAMELLDNLGFSEELKSRTIKDMSGGWRVRTMLAAAIFAKPDMLLLDEPTNHLSILAVLWLAKELSTSETWQDKIIVVVSHDRYFIGKCSHYMIVTLHLYDFHPHSSITLVFGLDVDQVCTDCLHISGVARRLTQTHGNYTQWSTKRKEQQIKYARESAKRDEEIKELKEFAGE